jgi:hypothetical protein
MSLIYRAIWRDDRDDLISKTSSSFIGWARDKHGEHLHFGPEPSTEAGITTSLLQARKDGVCAAEVVMIEDVGPDRWVTRQRVLTTEAGAQWIWVDLERTTQEIFRQQDVAAPRLVRRLLDDGKSEGGNPRLGSMAIQSTATPLFGSSEAADLATLVCDPHRAAPVIVFSDDNDVDVPQSIKRANITQEILAGVARVVVLAPQAEKEFKRLLGRDLAVWGGAARLYLPGSLEPSRHRYFLRDVVQRHPREVGRRIARILSGAIAAQHAPAPYEIIKPVLRGATGRSTDELLELADLDIAERDRIIQELRSEIELRDQQLFDRAVDIEALNEELDDQRRKVRFWMSQVHQKFDQVSEVQDIPATASSMKEAARLCQLYLPLVALPDQALHDLEELDTAPESAAWAKTSWRALKALSAYASQARDTNGGFWEWCKHSEHPDSWPASPKKLSMTESDSVLNNKSQRAARMLPISREVQPSGSIEMLAHMKIAEGGGTDIPRIYFYDDTKGSTGLIHVGFFGPHRYMENTKS